jgi:hypothetical protein
MSATTEVRSIRVGGWRLRVAAARPERAGVQDLFGRAITGLSAFV